MNRPLMRAVLEAYLLRQEFIRERRAKPTRIAMHPRVWVDLVATIEPKEMGWIEFRPDSMTYLMDMLVVEDDAIPGIAMLIT